MLRHLRFTNFKSWPKADLPCGRITGLFGTNASGKTSILQFLLLLKQTKNATDRALALDLSGPFVDLGTIYDTIHRHDENRTIEMGVTFHQESALILEDPADQKKATPLASGNEFTLSAEIAVEKRAPRTRRISYCLGNAEFSLSQDTKPERFQLRASEDTGAFGFVRAQGRAWPLPGPIKNYAFPDQVRTYYQNAAFLSTLEVAYEAAMDRIFYLGPLREFPRRDYMWARSRPTDVGQRGEKAIDAILAATDANETRNLKVGSRRRPFQEMVAYWLKDIGLIHDFKVVEIAPGSNRWQATVVTRPGAVPVLLTDVGFGVSQVLPVVTLLLYAPEGSTIILEQPEIHLHPLAQAGLADVIVHAAKHRNVQVILESHSEHLLLRLQRRIAEGSIDADEVKLYFCDAQRGESTLTPLQLDLLGLIRNWPEHFMGDAFGETAKAELARLHRMRKAAE